MSRAGTTMALLFLALACDAKPESPTKRAGADAKPPLQFDAKPEALDAKSPAADAKIADDPRSQALPDAAMPDEPAEEPAIEAGPAVTATREEREQAVLDLLGGATPAARYTRVDKDEGKRWNRALRDTIAPRVPMGGVAKVRMEAPTVTAGLERDIVRRVVRAHVNEIRHCYNQGLLRNSSLAGTVTIAYEIAATGEVATAKLESSTLSGNAGSTGATCIAKAVKRWKFPKPAGAESVRVVQTFGLEPK